MNKHSKNIFFFLCLALLLACNSKNGNKKNHPLLTLWYTNSPKGLVKLEFTPQNTLHIYNRKPYLNKQLDYMLTELDISKRDSFIQLMTINNKPEEYSDLENDFETHEYRISIGSIYPNKEIYILGHRAPQKYYDFVSWVNSLKLNL